MFFLSNNTCFKKLQLISEIYALLSRAKKDVVQKLQRDSLVNCTSYSVDEGFWKILIFYKMADV